MVNKRVLASALILLAALGAVTLAAQDALVGGTLKILAFSGDSRFVAFQNYKGKDAPIAADHDGWIYIVATDTRETVETTQISKFVMLEDNPNAKQAHVANNAMRDEAYATLESRGYTFEVEPVALPRGVSVDYTDKLLGSNSFEYVLTFSIGHEATGVTLEVAKGIAAQSDSKSRHEGQKVEEGFFGPAWSTFPGESSTTPDARTIIVFFSTPFMGEYDMGNRGAFIITTAQLSQFYNSVGFAYYRRGDIASASANFEKAYFHDSANPKAVYNMACMNALSGDVDRTLILLEQLGGLGTQLARQLMGQVHNDSDFDKVRGDARFSEFMKTVR